MIARQLFVPLVVAFVVWLFVAVHEGAGDPPPLGPYVEPAVPVAHAAHDVELVALRSKLNREHRRLLASRQRTRTLMHTLMHSTSTREAINLACSVYGACGTLWRRASCETGGTFSPLSHNPSGASGLFQFLPSTWDSTPFARYSIFSPYANALAAGWMEANGRGGEWVCR